MTPVEHLREIAAGRFSPAAQQWLSAGVARTIEDGDPQALFANLGLNECPNGWVTEIRRKEWQARLAKCYEILTAGGITTKWSAAKIIASEMRRSRTKPDTEISKLIKEATEIHPSSTRTEVGIYNALNRM